MARTRLCGKGGFTLIEILAVVVIMAILAGGVFMMMGAGDSKSKIAETNAQIQALSSLLEEYKNQYGEYPLVTNVDDQGYAALNFTFKVEDGGSCNECGNQPSSDKIAFGLASRFIPTATTIYQKTAGTNMESHYERCYANPTSQDSEAWEREDYLTPLASYLEELEREKAIIRSMTKFEKGNYKIIGPSRRKRIAKGSGTSVADVNRLLKKFEKSRLLMRKMMTNKKLQAALLKQFGK